MRKQKLEKWDEIQLCNCNKKDLSNKWFDKLQGQKIFYKYCSYKGITGIDWKNLFENLSDGVIQSVLFEHKLDEKKWWRNSKSNVGIIY